MTFSKDFYWFFVFVILSFLSCLFAVLSLLTGLFRETVSAPVWLVFVFSADCQCVARQVGKMLFSRRNAPVRKIQSVSDALAGLFLNIWRCPVCPLSVCTVIVRRSLRSAREPWLCRRCRCGR